MLGTWQSDLIALHDGRPRAVGKSQVHHNLYPTSTDRLEGEPSGSGATRWTCAADPLRWLFERLDERHIYYLSGEMMVGRKLEPTDPPTSTGSC